MRPHQNILTTSRGRGHLGSGHYGGGVHGQCPGAGDSDVSIGQWSVAGDDQINTGMIQEGFTGDGSDSEIMSYEGHKQIMTKVLVVTPG